ncbi:hypothetical protein NBRC116601_20100 [Cognatishimia sp. WU-CL00825]|uniref:hypothetical protein n=1 Tax=Cognatishimia sp. WU-CL00825 TaxID=3127658 RepID=UPI00310468C7
MENKKTPTNRSKPAQTREDRLKAALKANMGRRKAQARARTEPAGDKETGAQDKD